MKTTITKVFLLVTGLVLVLFAVLPGASQPLYAASTLSLTQTAEPPTLTPTTPPSATPTDTVVPPSATVVPPSATPVPPSATPVPAEPTRTPRPTNPPAGEADPQISKSVNVTEAQVGQVIEYVLLVTNRGTISATDVIVSDPLPAFLAVFNATTTQGLISVNGNTVTVAVGAVSPGQVVTIRIQALIVAMAGPGEGANTASLTTSSAGNIPINDVSGATIVTLPAPALTATLPSVPPVGTPGVGASPTSTPLPGGEPSPTATATAPGGSGPGGPPTPTSRAVSPGGGTRPPSGGTPGNLPPTGNDDTLRWLLAAAGLGLIGLSGAIRRRNKMT